MSGFIQLDRVDTSGIAYQPFGSDGYVFVADGAGGILAYTFDGSQLHEVGSLSTDGQATSVSSWGETLFFSAGTSGVYAYSFDGSSFNSIDEIQSQPSSWPTYEEVWYNDGHLYLSTQDYNNDSGKITSIEFDGSTFPDESSTLVEYYDSKDPKSMAMAFSENLIFAAAGRYISIYEQSEGGDTSLIYSKFINVYTNDIIIQDGYVFISSSTRPISANSYSEEAGLTEVALGSISDELWGDGEYIYASQGADIVVYEFDGDKFTVIARHTTPGGITDLWGDEEFLYVTNGSAGVGVYTKDFVTPDAPTIGDLRTTDSTPTLSGTAEADATVTVYADGEAVGTANADSSGAWSLTLKSALGIGHHVLTAQTTDEAGNVSDSSARATVIIDSVRPGLGTSADDLLIGTARADKLSGLGGNDTLEGRAGDDRLSGAGGNDGLAGDGGNDRLVGGNGEDRLDGGRGNDSLWGGSGNDDLRSGQGDDVLNGGAGFNQMTGGSGADRFVFSFGDQPSASVFKPGYILDFKQSEGDRLDFTKFDGDVTAPGRQSLTFIGSDRFSGTAGEIRQFGDGPLHAAADIDGDGAADFVLTLYEVHALTKVAFLL